MSFETSLKRFGLKLAFGYPLPKIFKQEINFLQFSIWFNHGAKVFGRHLEIEVHQVYKKSKNLKS